MHAAKVFAWRVALSASLLVALPARATRLTDYGELTYDGEDIFVDARVLTLNCAHALNSSEAVNGGAEDKGYRGSSGSSAASGGNPCVGEQTPRSAGLMLEHHRQLLTRLPFHKGAVK